MGKFDYSSHRKRTWRDYEVYIKRLRGNPNPILDMGSGIGLLLEACREKGIEAVGIEYEAEGVEETKQRGLVAYQHDLEFPADFLKDESFAAVISNQVIEHLSPTAQFNLVSEAFRVLKPGGQVLIMSPCRHFEAARQDIYHIGLLTPTELRQLMESVGFINCNMGYNRPQEVAEIPAEVLEEIWKKFRPDLLSKSATVLAYKPD